MMRYLVNQIEELMKYEPGLVQLALILVSAVVIHIVIRFILRHAQRAVELTSNIWDDAIVKAIKVPLLVVIWLIVARLCIDILVKKFLDNHSILSSLPILRVGSVLCISWFCLRFVRYFSEEFIRTGRVADSNLDHTTTDALSKLARIIIIVFAALVIAQNLGFSVSGILAAGGAGGLVIGFAAKDMFANFFGGLTIYLDRPFSVGDWIRCAEKEIEGTVEYIGWRHTRVRAFNANPIYVPNSIFTTVVVENPSRMTHRRIREFISLRYQDMDKMNAITSAVKKMLDEHQGIDNDKARIVNFDKFSSSSIDFLVYAFSKTTSWEDYAKIKQDIFLKIAKIVEEHKAEFAFPTHTVYLEKSDEKLS